MSSEGQIQCQMIQQRLMKALENLLHKRMKNSELHKKMGEIHEVMEMFDVTESLYLVQWDKFIIRNGNLKFPRIIWDMVISAIPDDANI